MYLGFKIKLIELETLVRCSNVFSDLQSDFVSVMVSVLGKPK